MCISSKMASWMLTLLASSENHYCIHRDKGGDIIGRSASCSQNYLVDTTFHIKGFR